MNRPAAIVVALLLTASAASAQAPQLGSNPPELCIPLSDQSSSRHDLEVAQLYGRRVPSPRWVGVTVVEWHILDNTTLDTIAIDRDDWVGEAIIDRCEILVIHARGADGSTIEMFSPTTSSRSLMVVAESPKAICAALQDCAAPALPDDPDSP